MGNKHCTQKKSSSHNTSTRNTIISFNHVLLYISPYIVGHIWPRAIRRVANLARIQNWSKMLYPSPTITMYIIVFFLLCFEAFMPNEKCKTVHMGFIRPIIDNSIIFETSLGPLWPCAT